MRAGDLARDGLGALDAYVEASVEAGTGTPPAEARPVRPAPVLPPPPVGAASTRIARPARSAAYPAAAVVEIRRRLEAAARGERERIEARALVLELARAQAAIVDAHRTLDAIDALEQSMRRASGDAR